MKVNWSDEGVYPNLSDLPFLVLTSVQRRRDPTYYDFEFGGLRAIEIHRGMRFENPAGTRFEVQSVYQFMNHVRLGIGYHYFGSESAPGWFYPGREIKWLDDLGQGMFVRTPDGDFGYVYGFMPNGTPEGGRTTIVGFFDCELKNTYREKDLERQDLKYEYATG